VQNIDYFFSWHNWNWSVKELILLCGGIFLITKALSELRHYHYPAVEKKIIARSISNIIVQIIFVDLIFAVDSVLAAVAMTKDMMMITISIVFSMIFMYFSSDFVIKYMNKSWRFNVLGMILIIFIGIFLIGQAVGIPIDKHMIISIIIFGCIYEGYITYLEHKRNKFL
jgi:predicted tellurium resistance membrane protein TerC